MIRIHVVERGRYQIFRSSKTTNLYFSRVGKMVKNYGHLIPKLLENRLPRLMTPAVQASLNEGRGGLIGSTSMQEVVSTLAKGFEVCEMTMGDLIFYKRLFSWYLLQINSILHGRGMKTDQVVDYLVENNLLGNGQEYAERMLIGRKAKLLFISMIFIDHLWWSTYRIS